MQIFLSLLTLLAFSLTSNAQFSSDPYDISLIQGQYNLGCWAKKESTECSLANLSERTTFTVSSDSGPRGCPAKGHIAFNSGVFISTANNSADDKDLCRSGDLSIVSSGTRMQYTFEGVFKLSPGPTSPLYYNKQVITQVIVRELGAIEVRQDTYISCEGINGAQCRFCERERASNYCDGSSMFCERDRYKSCTKKTIHRIESIAGRRN